MAAYRTYGYHERRYWKFRYDSIQQKTKMTKCKKSTLTNAFKVKFLTCNVFMFHKNLLSRLQSSCLPKIYGIKSYNIHLEIYTKTISRLRLGIRSSYRLAA